MAERGSGLRQDAPEQDVLSAAQDKQLKEENRKKTLAFNVTHVLVSLLFLWFLYGVVHPIRAPC
jgi:hypothetical protein